MRLGRARRSRDASADTKARSRRSSKTRENAGPWPHAGSVATKGFLALVLCGVACGPVALIRSASPAPAPAAAPAVDTTHHDRRAAQIALNPGGPGCGLYADQHGHVGEIRLLRPAYEPHRQAASSNPPEQHQEAA